MTTVLIVEDNEADVEALSRALAARPDWQVRIARSGEEGLAAILAAAPDCVLLDYRLAGEVDGLDFLGRLPHDGGCVEIPVVMLTAYGDEELAVAAMKRGIVDYLVKRVDGRHVMLLPTVVERALREREERLARRRAEAELELAANVLNHIAEGVFVTTPDGTIRTINPAFSVITGYQPEEVIGRPPRLLKSGRHDDRFYETMWREISERGHWQGEVWNRRKAGEPFCAWQTVTAMRDDRGEVTHYVSVFRDVTERKAREADIQHQAYYDHLTDLPNRNLFMDRFRLALSQARRSALPLAVMFVDLDHFKEINDVHGHQVGDEVLRQVAARLLAVVRDSDTVSRLGGDEFVVLLPNLADPAAAGTVASKALQKLEAPLAVAGLALHLGASIGIAAFPRDGDDASTLMSRADQAMYRVKTEGRNGWRFA